MSELPGPADDPKRVLKTINALGSPLELLGYVQTHHQQLDTINLATILYRLARLFSFIQAAEQRASWKQELLDNPQFSLLLRSITTQLIQGQAALKDGTTQGLNAWCLSNLLWALVKLEACEAREDVATLSLEAATAAAPLVIHFLPECSGQGVGNLLWSYVQIPGSPSAVLLALLSHVITLLEGPQAHVLDAHALAHALWSMAQVRARQLPVDEQPEWQEAVTKMLLLGAQHYMSLLTVGAPSLNPTTQLGDDHLLYQAMATISWSYSIILGSACGMQDPIRTMFIMIRQRAITRLQLILSASLSGRPLPHTLSASFNGVTLSNLVEAYETAQMLTPELLQAVFDVAAARLSRPSNGPQGLKGFKAEDLCVLLRMAKLGVANPVKLVQSLIRLTTQYRHTITSWTQQDVTTVQTAVNSVQEYLQSLPPIPTHMPAAHLQTTPRAQQQVHGGLLPVQQQMAMLPSHVLQTGASTLPRASSLDMSSVMGVPGLVTLDGHSATPSTSRPLESLSGSASQSSFSWTYSGVRHPASQPSLSYSMLEPHTEVTGYSGPLRGSRLPGLPRGGAHVAQVHGPLRGPPATMQQRQVVTLTNPGLAMVGDMGLQAPRAPASASGSSQQQQQQQLMRVLWGQDGDHSSQGRSSSTSSSVQLDPHSSVIAPAYYVSDAPVAGAQAAGGQQLWLMDAEGNLQPVTLVMQAGTQVTDHSTLAYLPH